ncbi:MAG: tandem-95 repeat protein [Rhabdochlamydiaceae bacterium]|nr:tandem-95 repeat protein [Rhabdochlamydiaceae bacterium]
MTMLAPSLKYLFRSICVFFFFLTSLDATYVSVYNTITNGGIAFTGNTLGLDKTTNQSNPGITGSIGAFISQDNSQHVGTFPTPPPGTTLDYTKNGSLAYLDLPPGSVVIHAELIWSGSYGYNQSPYSSTNADITLSLVDATSVSFITPDSVSHSVSPKPNYPSGTGQSRTANSTGTNVPDGGFYVRSQDVTALVAADVAAFVAADPTASYSKAYITGNVPGTTNPNENNLNCAGWTLAVAYSNPNMLTSNLSLYVACEGVDQGTPPAPVQVSGFTTPSSGVILAKLFSSALEGDAVLTGDQFKAGPNTTNPPTNVLSGTNNPSNNFFASQINTLLNFTTDVTSGKLVQSGSGLLDTRGSFGSLNSNAATGTNVTGNRQGYDITCVDLSSALVHNQTQLYTQGTTNQDVYTVNALGLQIQTQAPIIQSMKAASSTTIAKIGDSLTFTITFTNIGEGTATDLVFFDNLPAGLTFTSGSFTLSYNDSFPIGIPIVENDLITGVDLSSYIPSFKPQDTATIVFDVSVKEINDSYVNFATIDYNFVPFSTPIPLTSQTNLVTITGPKSPAPIANDDAYTTVVNTTLNVCAPGVLGNDSGTAIFVFAYDTTTTQGGSISMSPNGSFSYVPPTDFSGSGSNVDTFTYTIHDCEGRSAGPVTVRLTVTPLAMNDSGQVAANTPLNQLTSVFANDHGSGPFLLASYTQPTQMGSTVTVNADGTYTYTPATQFSGTDTFTYTAQDTSGQQTTAVVTIDVLSAAEDDFGTTPANTTLNGTSVFSNDPSVGTLTGWQNPSSKGGVVTMISSGPNAGDYTYEPPTNYSGLDTFTYIVSDGVHPPVVAVVHITVLPLANPDTATTFTNVVLNQGASVLATDAGVGLVVDSYDGSTVQDGTVAMNPTGTYTYTPPLNFTGIDSFTYTLRDQAPIMSTPMLKVVAANTSTTTVIINVLPLANNDSAMTMVNTPLNGPSVLTNDTPSTVTVTGVSPTTVPGSFVSMNADGTYLYIPPPNYVGQDFFTYFTVNSVGDTTSAVVTITIIGNGPPEPNNFIGKIDKCKFLNKTDYKLLATWNAPNNSTIASYRIYRNGKLIKEVSAEAPLIFEACSKSRSQLSGYEITAVDFNGIESTGVKLRIN